MQTTDEKAGKRESSKNSEYCFHEGRGMGVGTQKQMSPFP